MSTTPQTKTSPDGDNTPLIPIWKICLVGGIALAFAVAGFWLAFLPHGALGMNDPGTAGLVCFFFALIFGCECGAVIGNGRQPPVGDAGRKTW